ncbi:MAG: SRPBCC family protein [Solirubrobacteraceae bacterium]
MDTVKVSIDIGRPVEAVFAYLLDMANHAEYTDHYLVDWHLTRTDPVGVGAGARFRVRAPLQRFAWVGLNIVEVEPLRRIVEAGSGGKFNRIKVEAVYTLSATDGEKTQIELRTKTEPATVSDRLMELVAGRPWLRRQNGKALRRLRSILESGEGRGARPTVAGL